MVGERKKPMKPEIAVLWDKESPFKQYLTENGFDCEVITPKVLATPIFSFRACRLALVPAGFGNSFFSGILPDLRATSVFITDFVKAGCTLLVSGAFSGGDAYNWLPLKIDYVRAELRAKIERKKEHKAAAIVKADECTCDGYFEAVEEGWEVILAAKGAKDEKPILVLAKYGSGEIIATTIHEYPSEEFIKYCLYG